MNEQLWDDLHAVHDILQLQYDRISQLLERARLSESEEIINEIENAHLELLFAKCKLTHVTSTMLLESRNQ